ncbi:MAG: 2-amino-4-hydroxy-6-hydroxymethyldihydropteridine diphosphokinase [Candidatus Delongbacteria bacterium]|nr:2-amino-4-hydroxy-6-hydroxymethyldihydropteridine diphosphokinase [Candidatus Delongbacteria bacterium]MBN2836074.1 2-amino-4-hydroxy-6-hydroxymethyldihydropteridine diphosphokinase [Candidatus Delongbacteria bacterium]
MNRFILDLGSNINPEINIDKASKLLEDFFLVIKKSTKFFTDPIGMKSNNKFINMGILADSNLSQAEVKFKLLEIEDKLGRVRTDDKYSDRTIDIDIIIWNDEIVHNDYYKRDFVKQECLELGFEKK